MVRAVGESRVVEYNYIVTAVTLSNFTACTYMKFLILALSSLTCKMMMDYGDDRS